jgi:hypothetical protein
MSVRQKTLANASPNTKATACPPPRIAARGELVRQEEYATRSEAAQRERHIKKMKSRRWITELLERPDEVYREGR